MVCAARRAAWGGTGTAHPVAHAYPRAYAAVLAGHAPAGLAGHPAHAGTTRPGRTAPMGLVHALHLCAGPGTCRPAYRQLSVCTRWHAGRARLRLHARPVEPLSRTCGASVG